MFLLKIEIEGEFFETKIFARDPDDGLTRTLSIFISIWRLPMSSFITPTKKIVRRWNFGCKIHLCFLHQVPYEKKPFAIFSQYLCWVDTNPWSWGHESIFLPTALPLLSYHKNNGDFWFWQQKKSLWHFKEILKRMVCNRLPLCLSNDNKLNAMTSTIHNSASIHRWGEVNPFRGPIWEVS